MNINRTIIVTAANAPLARMLAAKLSPGGIGMFETPLPKKSANPTHYISSGQVDATFDLMLPKHEIVSIVDAKGVVTTNINPPSQSEKDAAAQIMFQSAQNTVTLEQCISLINTSIVVDCNVEHSEATCARFGLHSV